LPSDLIDLVFRKTVKKWQFMIKWLPWHLFFTHL
jgi:hypothetical protein